MNRKIIVSKLNKVMEDMGGGMVSSAAGIVGIESLPKIKKVVKGYGNKDKKKEVINNS